MKKVIFGLGGLGTVGRGVLELLRVQGPLLRERTGIDFELGAVFDRSWEKKRDLIGGVPAGGDPEILWKDPRISLVLELIGGEEPARTIIRRSLESGRAVITANKSLLSREGREIFLLAAEKNQSIGFEAAVAGALPIIQTLRRGLVVNNIEALYGIVNGTCNFILTRMEVDGMSYEDALKLAQEKGFAEADPSFDVDGRDAAQKLAVLSGLAFDCSVTEAHVKAEGIRNIRSVDLRIAESMGFRIRLLAVARRESDGTLLLRVHPAMIHKDHTLASVREEKNAVFLETSASGPLVITGKGAGSHPTAAAVISDMVAIAKAGTPERWTLQGEVRAAVDARYRFYLRFQTKDKPGVLAEIAQLLAEEGISIASVHQQEGREPVDVVVVTHSAPESGLFRAVEGINGGGNILAPTIVMRIEENV